MSTTPLTRTLDHHHNLLECLMVYSKPSKRQQPQRVTCRWRLLEESLVLQSSNHSKPSTRSSHTHNGSKNTYVRKSRAQVGHVCTWNGKESFLAQGGWVFIGTAPKTSRWALLRSWWSDHSLFHSQTVTDAMITYKFKIWLLEGLAIWLAS
jgi:hypothetical protein